MNAKFDAAEARAAGYDWVHLADIQDARKRDTDSKNKGSNDVQMHLL